MPGSEVIQGQGRGASSLSSTSNCPKLSLSCQDLAPLWKGPFECLDASYWVTAHTWPSSRRLRQVTAQQSHCWWMTSGHRQTKEQTSKTKGEHTLLTVCERAWCFRSNGLCPGRGVGLVAVLRVVLLCRYLHVCALICSAAVLFLSTLLSDLKIPLQI